MAKIYLKKFQDICKLCNKRVWFKPYKEGKRYKVKCPYCEKEAFFRPSYRDKKNV